MEPSPKGHEIRRISGDGWSIKQRGSEMESLGMQMRESAGILRAIADGAEGRGYSMDRVRENVGDLHEDLAKAGERYEPSGTVVRLYGEALVENQTTINTVVDNCEELWSSYESANGNYSDASGQTPPSDETEQQASQRQSDLGDLRTARNNAYDAWAEEAAKYDAPYETWDSAYANAVNGLQDANDSGVEDSFWDDALPFVEMALKILGYAGIVLAVLAIIVGGPLILLLGAIAGLVTLGLTIWKVSAGRGSGWEIATAAIGVFPFGRLAKLGTVFRGSGRFVTRLGQFGKGVGSDVIGLTPFREVRQMRGFMNLMRGPVRNSRGNLTQSRGIINQVRAFTSSVDGASYSGPRAWYLRATGGSNALNVDAVSTAYAQSRRAVTSRVDNALSGTILDGMQHGAGTPLETGLNVVDSVVKPTYGGYESGAGLVGDLTDPTSRWESELAAR